MSLSTGKHYNATRAFQSLSLSLPVETASYKHIQIFFSKILNISNEKVLLLPEEYNTGKYQRQDTTEILPRVFLPNDIWLKGEATIKDIKIRINMLLEINNMIEKELPQSGHQFIQIEDDVLIYYEKLLTAFKVFDMPERAEENHCSPDHSLREEDEDDSFSMYDNDGISRTTSNQSNVSLRTRHSIFGGRSLSSARRSSARDMSTPKKRVLSLLGNRIDADISSNGNGIPSVFPQEEESRKQQSLNGILAKSRIYNKLKKHRELSGSNNSNLSSPSSISHGNRNSLTTMSTTNSNTSRRRESSLFASPEMGEGRIMSIHSPISPQYTVLTVDQRQDNQKNKYEYYSQIKRLSLLTKQVIKYLDNSDDSYQLVKVLNFINKYVFRFIFIDIIQMITTYAQRKAYNFYQNP